MGRKKRKNIQHGNSNPHDPQNGNNGTNNSHCCDDATIQNSSTNVDMITTIKAAATATGGVKKNKKRKRRRTNKNKIKSPAPIPIPIPMSEWCPHSNLETVYSNIMRTNKLPISESSSTPPFNWVNPVFISSTKEYHNNKEQTESLQVVRDITNQNFTNDDSIEHNIKNENPESSSYDDNWKEQISILQTKLDDLKQALWPAATKCTSSKMTTEHDDDELNTRTGQEFRKARSICNPLEQLNYISMVKSKSSTSIQNNSNKVGKPTKQHNDTYVCRSAMKLANIDAMLNFPFTTTTSSSSSSSSTATSDDANIESSINESPFVFVDLCGAPGGFSEYLLLQHHYNNTEQQQQQTTNNSQYYSCRGYGMSLNGTNEHGSGIPWKLNHTLNQIGIGMETTTTTTTDDDCASIMSYEICTGVDGTGDIYNWDNVMALYEKITTDLDCTTQIRMKKNGNTTTSTDNENQTIFGTNSKSSRQIQEGEKEDEKATHCQAHSGIVDLVVADGGFDAQRDSENQETLAHKIIVNQCAAALQLLKQSTNTSQREENDTSSSSNKERGGMFVMKMFGFQNTSTRKLMLFLHNVFREIHILKPVTSRPASAERYIVCLDYYGGPENHDFDVLIWRDEMLNESSNSISNNEGAIDDSSSHLSRTNVEGRLLFQSLDQADHDILHLNIQACFQIISYLESTAEGNTHHTKKADLDLASYRKYWK